MNINDTKVNQECNSSEQNKPIVYWDGKHFASKDKSSLADIPLYTHPVKELTDEKEALKSLYDAVIRYENLSPFADTYAVESCEFQLHDAKEKARAILKKGMGLNERTSIEDSQ